MIVTDEKILRAPCEKVLETEISDIIGSLEKELMNSANLGNPGIGLAAPQIGIHKRVAIIRVGDNKIDLVNPVIVKTYDKIRFEGEGCLSFPGVIESTERFSEIEVENDIEPRKFIATGLTAIAVQHEIDHLNSILLPDVAIKQNEPKKTRPNDPCHCGEKDPQGNIKKYKKCHGK